ncbi:MAG: hypothetical protein K0R57_1468 [Paenibacillaceae bacterium]|jgi:two-component system response regulator YesN|nr:hypothetical protein [Paenibacillaceae bacterium]
MWKILLVEDEPFVRRSIRSSIPWEEHGFMIAGEASHGKEALALIEELMPDIILSDIIMPYMDGIELLKEVRKNGSEAIFIMLTCANEFEYARMALEYGASSYILKLSMNDDQLIQALNKAKLQLMQQTKRQRQSRQDSLQADLPLLWKSMLGKELSGDEERRLSDFRTAEQQYGQLVLLSALSGWRSLDAAWLRERVPVTGGQEVVCSYSDMGQTTFFVWGGLPLPARFGLHEGFPIHGSPETRRNDGPVVCRTVSRERTVEEEWLHNLEMLDSAYYGGEDGGIPNGPRDMLTIQREKAGFAAVPWELEREIIRAFEDGSLAECRQKLADIWGYMRDMRMHMVLVKETAERFDKIFSRISQKAALRTEDIRHAVSHQAVQTALLANMEQYARGRGRSAYPETDHPEINKIIRYVRGNYDQDISLQAMAAYVNMAENYLSVLFKKKTGDTFINYLQQIRVSEAKFYLEQTELPVALIGERAGFANPSYFFKVFKRWTGLTPSEFRAEHKNQERP